MRGAIGRLHDRTGEKDVDRRVARWSPDVPSPRIAAAQAAAQPAQTELCPCRAPGYTSTSSASARTRGASLRRAPPRAMPEMVGTRGKPLRERIDTGQQVIYKHFEVVAGKIGNPVLEIAAGGAVPKERREEADLDPRPGANTPRQRAQPFRRARFHEPVHEVRITRLQRLVIAALIREKKVAPAQLVEHALRRQARRTQRRFAFNRREALAKTLRALARRPSYRPTPSAASGNGRTTRAASAHRVASACAYAARAPARSSRSASVPASSNAALASRRSSSQARAKSSAAAGRSLRSRRSPARVTIAPRWFGSRVSARRNAISAAWSSPVSRFSAPRFDQASA